MAQVNWTQIKKDAGDMTPVPIGVYDAYVESAELKVAGSGNEYYKLKFKIQSGPHTGRVLYNNVVLVTNNPRALQAFFINMAALGLSQDQIVNSGGDTAALVPLLVGRQARLTVSHQDYQGQTRENVERMDKHAGGPIARGAGAAAPQPAQSAAPIPTAAPTPAPAPQAPAPVQAAPAPVPAPAPEQTPMPSAPAPAQGGVAAPPLPF